ncbi:hypothetical protein TTHERM_00703370 (macronuclear) [Tetrahymena thermophila SB210]|uniref:Uncharacterized protein n=1 Tax=Tetrahymena thermophila (strain SB210) TaxID=312017 RepID=Q22GI6_TETTS|nr:hypothetical protein TTHERM_00703370 [Tetrahymena thermophila SB210]EAR84345.2 hypothetical protein TTHERM_00703370 [Tetrahymena thermophila SB210]|eukprot:XP_001032008.2 hypothetical protein TTHERM_00703370 [Tetrahymena thermophila SB210]
MQQQEIQEDPFYKTINFKNRKTEISYHHLKQEYATIERNYGKLSSLIIDFSFCQIKQTTIDRVMKDLFMIYEIDDDRFQHKFFFLEDLTIKSYQNLFQNLDFISYFFIYKNIKTIKVECDATQAYSFFNATKSSKKVEKITCEEYFQKFYSVYEIDSNSFITQIDLSGVEDQIQHLNIMIESNNLDKHMQLFSKASTLQYLNMTIINLQDFKKDFKQIIKNLQQNAPLLNKLHILLYTDDLIPPIKKDKFQSHLSIEVSYRFPLNCYDYKSLLRKVYKFADQNDSLTINPTVQYNNFTLKLDFSKQTLSQDDLSEFFKFISKCNNKLLSIQISFHKNQEITNRQWVNIINYLGSYEELKTVIINGTNVSVSVVALSVAKLMKCRKNNININGQTLLNNSLSLNLFQLSDYTLDVICLNIFDEKAPRVSCLSITAHQVMGDLQPFSNYLSRSKHLMNQLKIRITSQNDIMNLFYGILNDIYNIKRFVNSISFTQDNGCSFNASSIVTQIKIEQGNNLYSFRSVNNEVLTEQISQLVRPIIMPLESQQILNNEGFDAYAKRFQLFMEFRKVLEIYRYKKSQPSVMLAFYTLIGPELMNNPYQIYTDLYYD